MAEHNTNRERIAAYIAANPDWTYMQVKNALGISSTSVVLHHVRKLKYSPEAIGRKELVQENLLLTKENQRLMRQLQCLRKVLGAQPIEGEK